jgi:Site-specific recombinases, DNA invertase Pin homologs
MSKENRAAIYCRLACANDDRIAKQKAILQNYAEMKGYTKISVYEDNGVGGLDYDRPALSRLEADIQAGSIDVVIVQSIDRIGRNDIKTIEWITGILQKGVKFVSLS